MYQMQRQGGAFILLLAISLPFIYWIKPSGVAIVWTVVGFYVATPFAVMVIEMIRSRRREMRRVPRAVVSRRRRR